MAKYLSKIASDIHDDSPERILKDTTMSGDISVSFETETSFFDAIHVLGKKMMFLSLKNWRPENSCYRNHFKKLLYIDQEPPRSIISVHYEF